MIKVFSTTDDYKKLKTKALVVGVFEGQPCSDFKKLNELCQNEIFEEFKTKEFRGELKKMSLYHTTKAPKRILFIGLGKREEFNLEKIREVVAKASTFLRDRNIKTFTVELFEGLEPYETAYAINEGVQLALYDYTYYKTQNLEDIKQVSEYHIKCTKSSLREVKKALARSQVVLSSVYFARDLQNEPSGNKNPEQLTEVVTKISKEAKLSCKILDLPELRKLGMNLIVEVNRGSAYPAKFAILQHKAKGKDTVVLVGKGITFDSGGIQLKPELRLEEMKYDMSGAAVVLGVLRAASMLKLPLNIIGLIPMTENMPSGSAFKPGDIVKSLNGKTVEILHTDAEGRLVLADALAYAKKFKPKAIIDIATLTGSCVAALGNELAGLFTKNDNLSKRLVESGERTYERVWPMPLVEEYKEDIKSAFADLQNLGVRGEAGAITAALFLQEFVDDTPWAHIDIAGTAYLLKDKPFKPKGGTGFGVRLLIDFLDNWKK